jgi:hypothetical protein
MKLSLDLGRNVLEYGDKQMLEDSNLDLIPYTHYSTLQGLLCKSVHCASGNTTQPVQEDCSPLGAVLYHIEAHSL